MEQDVHSRIGKSCQQSYIRCRQEGEHDVMAIMMQIAEDLNKDWMELYDDAFVNAWDIANYASDYLVSQLGVEGCECSAKIH